MSEPAPTAVETAEPKDYSYWGNPDGPPPNLLTKNLLKEKGLKPARDQMPAGRIWVQRRQYYIWLYDETQATPVLPATEGQKASQEKARRTRHTCKVCGEVKTYSLVREPDRTCYECREKARFEAIGKEAQELLADPDRVCFLDTETTGLYSPFVIQVAAIDGRGQVLLDTRVRLEPGREIEPEASEVHGLTQSDLADAPDWREVWPRLRAACRGRTIVTYNLQFDLDAIRYTCHTCGIEDARFGRTGNCAMELYAEWIGEIQGETEWGDAAYRWQPLPGGDHSALGDAQAVLKLVRMMAGNRDK